MSHDPLAKALDREALAAADLLTGLASDDPDLNHDMVEGETGFLEAIGAAVDALDECEIIISGCKEKEKQVADRRLNAERRLGNVRALIERALVMADLPSVKLPTATLTVKSLPPKPIVTDESVIPSEFWEPQPPKLDRKALSDAAKQGAIPGVEMSNGSVSLQIRRV